MQLTEDDKRLLLTLPQKVEEMKQGILRGEPYVWKLRLSLKEFYDLESAGAPDKPCGENVRMLT